MMVLLQQQVLCVMLFLFYFQNVIYYNVILEILTESIDRLKNLITAISTSYLLYL